MQNSGAILIVAAEPLEADRIEDMVTEARLAENAGVERASSLEGAITAIHSRSFDVALVDPQLPDSSGADTIQALRSAAPHVPVVALIGRSDGPALEALAAGAHDCLPKGMVTATLLSGAIRHAIRRQSALGPAGVHLTMRRQREQRLSDSLGTSRGSILIEQGGAYAPLRLRSPHTFSELCMRYRSAVERRLPATGVDADRAADIELVADQLAAFSADSRDTLELHRVAVDAAIEHAPPRATAEIEERGEYALIELLALVANRYRGYALLREETAVQQR